MMGKGNKTFLGGLGEAYYDDPTDLYEWLYGSKKGNPLDNLNTFITRNYRGMSGFWIDQEKGVELTYLSPIEKERSQSAYFNKTTQFKEEDVSYKLSKLGLRTSGIDFIKDYVNTITIGCSFTLGEGLPFEYTWSDLISKKMGWSYENLGFPGASISRITRILTTVLPIKRPKRLIVLFPDSGRQELVIDNDESYLALAYAPNHPLPDPTIAAAAKDYERALSSNIDLVDMYKNFHIIKLLAESLDIELIVSSWSPPVYNKLKDVFQGNQIASPFHFIISDPSDHKARDGSHPGINPNKLFTERLEFLINQNRINGE